MKKSKIVPRYWWDFKDDNAIIVESDSPLFPIVSCFYYDPKVDGREPTVEEKRFFGFTDDIRVGCAEEAIEKADKLISDLNAGRADPRKLHKEWKRK